jgi:hypothetical protein
MINPLENDDPEQYSEVDGEDEYSDESSDQMVSNGSTNTGVSYNIPNTSDHSTPLQNNEPNAGFVPLEDNTEISEKQKEQLLQQKEELKKRKRDPAEVAKETLIKKKINKLVTRYPGLVLRTSAEMLKRLADFDKDELQNIYDNCISDLASVRGTPEAEFIIYLITYHINLRLDGFMSRCQDDVELKRDIEEAMMDIFGAFNIYASILFRLCNNLFKTMYDIRDNYKPHEARMNELFLSKEFPLGSQLRTTLYGNSGAEEVSSYIKPIEMGEDSRPNKRRRGNTDGGSQTQKGANSEGPDYSAAFQV